MEKYLYDYINKIDKILSSNTNYDLNELKKEHLIKIKFFSHERLIHLIVTLSYALFMMIFLALAYINPLYIFIALIFVVFLIFYVRHYFKLENGVQYLYKQYDKMQKDSIR